MSEQPSQSNSLQRDIWETQTSVQVLAQRVLELEKRTESDREGSEKRYVLKTDMKPIVALVYGMAGTILVSVLGAILTGQIHLPK